MQFDVIVSFLALALFAGMLGLLEIGRRIGAQRVSEDQAGAEAGMGAVDGAVFALLGLLLAFTFSGAATRFDVRRQLVLQEANAIGTAYLRVDMLPAELQPALRDLFRRYVDSRLEVYRKIPDVAAAMEALNRSGQVQKQLWSAAVAATGKSGYQPGTMLLLPAINEMIDITTTRALAAQTHPPMIVFVLLFALALASALLAGVAMGAGKFRSWVHMVIFAAAIAIAVQIIVDLEYPRIGLIRIDALDQLLVDARASMN